MPQARSKKRRPLLLAELERRYLASSSLLTGSLKTKEDRRQKGPGCEMNSSLLPASFLPPFFFCLFRVVRVFRGSLLFFLFFCGSTGDALEASHAVRDGRLGRQALDAGGAEEADHALRVPEDIGGVLGL